MAVSFTKTDLQHILQQILMAETGQPPLNPHLATGLRQVLGTNNNSVPGQETFGAADQPFANATDQYFQTVTVNVDGTMFDPNPLVDGDTMTTSYSSSAPGPFMGINVVDSAPRTISNLISDLSSNNPAAVQTAQEFGAQLGDGYTVMNTNPDGLTLPGADGVFGTADDILPIDPSNLFIGNITPDAGLSAPFNNWMTFFGQFFDHGLDLITKGDNGTVLIPLMPDDPLYSTAPGAMNFMALTRATQTTITGGADGITGDDLSTTGVNEGADDVHQFLNTTTPFVDQNQTYSSHPSHQVFLREYVVGIDGDLHSTGRLLTHAEGRDGILGNADDNSGMATWADLKANALKLGIVLTDYNIGNVPLLVTDAYGNFIRGPLHGGVQVITDSGTVEMDPAAPALLPADAQFIGHAFINDMAHTASPFDAQTGVALAEDADAVAGPAPEAGAYDDELLDAHYVAGDGRVNENIALITVHEVFHEEHNRLIDQVKAMVQAELDAGDSAFAVDWVLPGVVLTPGVAITDAQWNGERLFQVAKFGTETQYQHLVFEEFARKVAPTIHLFGNNDIHLDPAITSEFANAVYRFGHSMLTEDVPLYQLNADGTMAIGPDGQPILTEMGLIQAFVNPLAFADLGATGAAQIVQGTTHQIGSEIDEFVTGALRNNLLGLPLDLAALNIARGRDTGVAPLNLVRAQIYDATNDVTLKPYENWAEFGQYLKHAASLINFVAAYGTHASVNASDLLADKRDAALALVTLGLNEANKTAAIGSAERDAYDFMHSLGAYANDVSNPIAVHAQWSTGSVTGVDNVDLWIGGLAEKQNLFGGLLGSTFNFIFETQLESLQDGDRLYYLPRIEGMDFGSQIENNSFADMIIANTGAKHIPASIFLTPEYTVEASAYFLKDLSDPSLDPSVTYTLDPQGFVIDPAGHRVATDPSMWLRNPVTNQLLVEVLPDGTVHFIGDDNFFGNTMVLGGTEGNDRLQAGHADDDTVWGDGGDDWIDGGNGNDFLYGGTGNDTIVDSAGDDVIHGEAGNDSIFAGIGDDIIFAGDGDDYVETGAGGLIGDAAVGGAGNDIIIGGEGDDALEGNEGDDWIEGGAGGDGLVGDTGAPTGMVPLFAANDVLDGGANGDKMVGFSGDDIMLGEGGFDKFNGLLGFDWADFEKEQFGVSVDMERREFIPNQQQTAGDAVRDFFIETEATSGSKFNDFIQGTETNGLAAGVFNELQNVDLIFNLNTFFAGGQAYDWDATGAPIAGSTSFSNGNILLGGDGSDQITGRGGNDIIDGDAWLHVELTNRAAGGDIVRQIQFDTTEGDIDTAIYRDVAANYIIEADANTGAIGDADGDGFITVAHSAPLGVPVVVNGITTFVRDGVDRVRNIERLQFADVTVNIDTSPDANGVPTGALVITDDDGNPVTPVNAIVGTPLTIDLLNTTVSDSDGIVAGSEQYQWQQQVVTAGGGLQWLNIAGATGTTFTPASFVLGNALRVVETYTDGKGLVETIASVATNLVAPNLTVNTAPFVVAQQAPVGLPDTIARIGFPVNIALPLTTVFGDNETASANLVFSATLANGQPLASVGLAFNLIPDGAGGVSGATITGNVANLGPISVRVTATDLGNPNIPGVDAQSLSVTDTFVINVQNGNLAPVISLAPESNTGLEDTAIIGDLLGPQVPDPDGPSATPVWRLVQGSATNGTVAINGNTGHYVFTPTAELSSDDLDGPPVFSFQYRLFDGLSYSQPKTVLIDVDAVDDGVAPVTITGTAASGGTLSALIGIDPDGPWQGGSETFQWYRDGIAIGGATAADLVLTDDDIGHTLSVHAGYTDAQGFVYSGASEVVSETTDPIGIVAATGISGGGTPSRILAVNTLSDPDGGILQDTISYLWEISSDGVNFDPAITGVSADTLTYTPPAPPNGSPPNSGYVRLTVTYIDAFGNLNTATGAAVHYVVDNAQTHTFSGTALAELIFGNGGADQITALGGNDFVQGGGGGDTFFASVNDGDDTYDGGNGNDTYNLSLTAAAATVTLANGGGNGTATSAQTGADTLVSVENVVGGTGNDTITGNNGANVLTGGGGNDTLNGGSGGTDTAAFSGTVGDYGFSLSGLNLVVTDARGGSPDGADTLFNIDTIQFGNLALNLVFGTNGNNTGGGSVNGGNGADLLLGLLGNDTINGNGGADVLVGGAGNDALNGGAGNDTAVFSGPLSAYGFSVNGAGNLVVTDNRGGSPDGVDTLNGIQNIQFGSQVFGLAFGDNGNDNVNGGTGSDLLLGLNGNDELDGGAGADVMIGGAGTDDFNFSAGDTGVGAGNRDIIFDFLGGGGSEDIDLSAIDANTTTGGNGTFNFIGTAAFSDPTAGATLAAGQVRYQLFDTDGNGSLDSTLIQANFNNDLAPDFEIVLQGFTSPLVAADFIL